MILTCPECASRYLLSAQVLAPDGRTVKCSNCGAQWFQAPDEDELASHADEEPADFTEDHGEGEIEDIPEGVKPLEEGANVPALPEEDDEDVEGSSEGPPRRSFKSNALGYLAACFIGVMIFGALIAFKPMVTKAWQPAAGLYHMAGMPVSAPGEGLVFDRVTAKVNENGGIVVDAQIINLASEDVYLPSIEVSVRDAAGNIIKETLVHPPFESMKPESTLPFQSTYVGDTDNADHVQVRFVLRDKEVVLDSATTEPVTH